MTGSLRQTPGTFYVDLVLPLLCLQLLTLGKGGRGIGHWPGVLFCSDYFLGWRIGEARRILNSGGLRLEDVSSGYWTPPAKRSSGLVSLRSLGFARDFGSRLRRRESASSSGPSSCAWPSTFVPASRVAAIAIIVVFRRGRTNWQRYEPRMTTGAFDCWGRTGRELETLDARSGGVPRFEKRETWGTRRLGGFKV
jgi:hypothetical protein